MESQSTLIQEFATATRVGKQRWIIEWEDGQGSYDYYGDNPQVSAANRKEFKDWGLSYRVRKA